MAGGVVHSHIRVWVALYTGYVQYTVYGVGTVLVYTGWYSTVLGSGVVHVVQYTSVLVHMVHCM